MINRLIKIDIDRGIIEFIYYKQSKLCDISISLYPMISEATHLALFQLRSVISKSLSQMWSKKQ